MHDAQLLKGVLSVLLLAEVARAEGHGYELVGRLQDAGLPGLSEGTVYPALTRLEREGMLAHRLVPSSTGPARKVYRLTPAGRSSLEVRLAQWQDLSNCVSRVSGSLPAKGEEPRARRHTDP